MNRRRFALMGLALALASACTASAGKPPRPEQAAPKFERPGADLGEPCGLAVAGRSVWILGCRGSLLRVPKDGVPSGRPLAGEVLAIDGLVAGPRGESLWALLSTRERGARRGTVVEIDPATGATRSSVVVGSSVPIHATPAGDVLWVAMLDGRLLSLDAAGPREVDDGEPLVWTAVDEELWTVTEQGVVSRRSSTTGALLGLPTHVPPGTIAFRAAHGSLWAAPGSGGAIRIGPDGRTEQLRMQGTVNAIERCGKTVWLSQPDFGLREVAADGTVRRSIKLDEAPRYLACDGTRLWVLTQDGLLGSVDVA